MRLILASSSPRRRELLHDAGYEFEVVAPNEDVEDLVPDDRDAVRLVAELAFYKAQDVQTRAGEGTLIAADTVAECDDRILGKPGDAQEARQMLRLLRGRRHRVYTGLCVWPASEAPLIRVATTTLRMDDLSDVQIEEYLVSGLWQGKAGAFGYQDRHGWLRIVEGSESNVVGLPLELLAEMLAEVAG